MARTSPRYPIRNRNPIERWLGIAEFLGIFFEEDVDPGGSALLLSARWGLAEANLAQPEPQVFGQAGNPQAGTKVGNRPLRLFYGR